MKKYSNLIPILVSTMFLLVIAFYNHYPLFTSDSGAYINNAFHFEIPKDRPVFYSLFILLFSIFHSLWTIILAQTILLSYLMNTFLKVYFRSLNPILRILIILLTVIFTSVAWYSAQIMPDIFTPILALASLIYLSEKSKHISILIPIILFSILVHNSNVMIAFLFFGAILAFSILKFRQYLKKSLLLFSLVLCSLFINCFTNYKGGYGFILSPSSHVFLMGKLVENGILKKYLDEHCNQNSYKLCEFKDELPQHAWDFIWNNEGAFAKTGSWDSSKTEYSEIIKQTLIQPKYLALNISEMGKASYKQFKLTDVGDGLWAYGDGTNPFWKVQESFNSELNQYTNSKQNQSKLKFEVVNKIYKYSFYLLMIISILILAYKKDKNLFYLFALIMLFTFLNAFVTGSFANILARLNSRCIWLLPFMGIGIVVNFFRFSTEKKLNIYNND